jgi:hypothetical protein
MIMMLSGRLINIFTPRPIAALPRVRSRVPFNPHLRQIALSTLKGMKRVSRQAFAIISSTTFFGLITLYFLIVGLTCYHR